MGEIRLTDDDKDRKYRIRINEDGEEEIEIIPPEERGEEVQETEELDAGFYGEEDEEKDVKEGLSVLIAEHKQKMQAEAQEYILKAEERLAAGDSEYALVLLDNAQKSNKTEGRIYSLKLSILTDEFTDFSQLDDCDEVLDDYIEYVSVEEKAQFKELYAQNVKAEIDKQQAALNEADADNEQKKAERRARFVKQRNVSLRNFLIAFVPFVALLCVAAYFTTIMYSDKNGGYFVATIVLWAADLIAFIAAIILLRPLVRALNRLRVNKSNASTAIGRTVIEGEGRLEQLTALYNALLSQVAPYNPQPDGE